MFDKNVSEDDINKLRKIFRRFSKDRNTEIIGIWTGSDSIYSRIFYAIIRKWKLEYLKDLINRLHEGLDGIKFVKVRIITDIADRRIL